LKGELNDKSQMTNINIILNDPCPQLGIELFAWGSDFQ